jgi:hypothetical protein
MAMSDSASVKPVHQMEFDLFSKIMKPAAQSC